MQVIAFDPFCLDAGQGRLWHGREEISLRPKSFAVLRYLAERPGQLVTKHELLRSLWADTAVSDTVLRVCVREIRAALGDVAATPRFVETVGRRGYRFVQAAALQHNGVVGRDRELQQLDDWLRQALSGTRRVVFVTGEAGIGKSTLIARFLDRVCLHEGVRVARSHCIEQGGEGEAWLPVLDLLGCLCRGPGANGTVEVLARYAPSWVLQMPALLDEARLRPLRRRARSETRARMLREFAEAIEALAADTGLVLVIDDLQWGDAATVELLSYLAQRSERARLLVVASYRPAQVALHVHPVQAIKRDLQIRGQCVELPVEPLTETDVSQYLTHRLAGARLSADLPSLIHRRTEGNALFMVSVVDHLVRCGVLVQQGDQWRLISEIGAVVPETLQQFIAQQLEMLDADEVKLLEIASVAGMQFAAATVAACLKAEVNEVDERCAGLTSRDLFVRSRGIIEWPDGTVSGSYEFRHTLYQSALYDRLPEARRVHLHRAIGERMERAYGAEAGALLAPALAEHFERARDRRRAIQYRRQAGEIALRRGTLDEALFHLRRALRLLAPNAPAAAAEESVRPRLPALRRSGAAEVERLYQRVCRLSAQLDGTATLAVLLPAALGGPLAD
jgi:DNA-binding winged helix-turn-helix (wHTH) protein